MLVKFLYYILNIYNLGFAKKKFLQKLYKNINIKNKPKYKSRNTIIAKIFKIR